MRQALHIFRKDIRFLRGEILLLLLLAALLGFAETHVPIAAEVAELLVVLAVNYVIARVIHAETIPGQNQFWITRPYRWDSLLGAKALFILAFVNLPVFAAQCYMVLSQKFVFTESLPGLIWSQVLMVMCISLPAACLASLTAGLIPFLLAEFMVVGGAVILDALLVRYQAGPEAVDWVRDSIALALVTGVAIFVLRWQYRTRRTEIGDRLAIGGAVLGTALFLGMPWQFAMGVQATFSKQAFDASAFQASLASVAKSVFPPPMRGRSSNIVGQISLPIVIGGVENLRDLTTDALSVTLIGADGRTWRSGYINPIPVESHLPGEPEGSLIVANLRMDPAFFQAESSRPVTVHARLYFTFFGEPNKITIPIQPDPVNAIDGLQCSSGLFNQLYCRSIFQWPRRRVYAKTGEGNVESYIRSVSYSPFPATLGFNPIEQHMFSGSLTATQATVVTEAPLSHFQVEREIGGVSLLDYTEAAKRKAMMVRPPDSFRVK